ncbi:hypothetical protein PVL29_001029 [Vitis rotundifolia]|uniref:Fucosyltransferase n=1 Tax=Vitis rotundifolia TaxID=103349 RepID=A0AA39E7Q4_VITRO|nr:hypothetical protein PVL29_001029 [Vitis rotundifolia]
MAVIKSGSRAMSFTKALAVSLISLPFLFTLFILYRNPPSDPTPDFREARVLDVPPRIVNALKLGPEDNSSQPADMSKDSLLGGLLAAGFGEKSCLSRYQSVLYRKISPYKPSSYLLSRLRKYEDLHKHCGPHTKSYRKTIKLLKSGHSVGPTDCNYVVWISYSGLGNRILTLASAFLYALLTNRVLLVDRGKDMADLFCEPFPEKSWLLPLDFPLLPKFNSIDKESPHCFGKMLKNNIINSSTEQPPPFVYIYLSHDYGDHDKLFFCDQEQTLLGKVPWLIMKTNNYFAPSLFLMPSFEQELSKLFPEKETTFHHLGRYLFHPSNQVWGLITRFYKAYLAESNERIGIQIRTFDSGTAPFQYVIDQIMACTLKKKLLPEVNRQEAFVTPAENQKSIAVLMTSLNSGYSDAVRNMYWEQSAMSGEVVSVYQPSHEEVQQSEKQGHNRKAWAEMYLLSTTEALITSAWSTFGYVAQGLGGVTPWILYKPQNRTAPDPPCGRAMSMEPCFHAPPFYDCKAKTGVDTGALVPHVRHCEDMSWGLKLVGSHREL